MSKAIIQNIERATHRARIKGLGFSDNEISKELIGVFTGFSGFNPSKNTQLVDRIKDGISANDGISIVFPITSFDDAMSIGVNGNDFALPSRELTADSIESLIGAYHLDGAVFVADSDNTLSGMLLGSARTNIPSIFVSCGIQNQSTLTLSELFESVGAVRGGKRNVLELGELESNGVTTNELYHMPYALEAIGLSLKNSASAKQNSSETLRLAYQSGSTIVSMSRDQFVPRMILTKPAFTNALALLSAIGASTNTVLHLLATANECGLEISQEQLDLITRKAPQLLCVKSLSNLSSGNGVMSVLKQLLPIEGQKKKPLIDTSVKVVGASSLSELLDGVEVDEEIIASSSNPINSNGAICVLNGNLAEDGALMNTSACVNGSITFAGKARVFNSDEEAMASIANGSILKGDCIVLRYCGAKSQGMRDAMPIACALMGVGLSGEVGLVTEGRLSGTYPFATAVHVCKEALDGGTIALVNDGDKIIIDSVKQKLSLEVSSKELAQRKKKWKPELKHLNSFLLRYSASVTPASKGAIYKNKF